MVGKEVVLKDIQDKTRRVVAEYRRLLNNAHFRRQALDELDAFMEGLRSQGSIDAGAMFIWADGALTCRWKFPEDTEHSHFMVTV